jgi:LysM repeat protein
MGLIQNGKPVDSAIRAFQKKNGLEVDGIIGNDTSNAIISAATTGMPNIGRGNQGGATPYQKTLPTMPTGGGQKIGGGQVAQGPARPGVPGPVSTGRQPWEHTPPAPEPVQTATPVPAAINRGTNTKYKNLPVQAATPVPPAAGSVVVKSGDTLSRIAAANGTTVQAIMAANPSIKDPNRIAAGQTVKLRESSDLARIRHLAGLTRN